MSVFQGADLEALTDEQLALLAHEAVRMRFPSWCSGVLRLSGHAAMYRRFSWKRKIWSRKA